VNRRVLLDIDLDYFACRESILNEMGYELEITKGQYEAGAVLLNDPTLPYSRLSFESTRRDGSYFARVGFMKNPEVCHIPPPCGDQRGNPDSDRHPFCEEDQALNDHNLPVAVSWFLPEGRASAS